MRSMTVLLWLTLAAASPLMMHGAAQEASAPVKVTGLPLDAMTPEQQALFADAKKDFAARDYKSALGKMQQLHQQRPADRMLADGTAETAINAGDYALAMELLKPLLADDDWHAHTFLARVYAETHDPADRDRELKKIVALQAESSDPQFRNLTQILLERIPLQKGYMDLYWSVKPWSRYNIYAMGRIYDASGRQVYRVTLESADFDQPSWQKQHPDLAAKGMRMFSLDGYSEPVRQANGSVTQTHATFGFLDGQPSYEDLRARMMGIGDKSASAVSTSVTPMPGAAAAPQSSTPR